MSRTVFLLSDFGVSDTYVAQMKSVLLEGTPEGTALVDLTHDVPPGGILEGAFHLWASGRILPQGSVVLAVVDPGVGSERMGIAVQAGGRSFIGPDNGLFGLLDIQTAWRLPEPPPDSSRTFHGRDVFAPAAARLITDPGWSLSLEELDPCTLVPLELAPARRTSRGFSATAVHVDNFGNIVLWVTRAFADEFSQVKLTRSCGESVELLRVDFYDSARDGFLLLEGSQGLMEIALNGASASRSLEIAAGDRLHFEAGQ